jgi:hypothetical protein
MMIAKRDEVELGTRGLVRAYTLIGYANEYPFKGPKLYFVYSELTNLRPLRHDNTKINQKDL